MTFSGLKISSYKMMKRVREEHSIDSATNNENDAEGVSSYYNDSSSMYYCMSIKSMQPTEFYFASSTCCEAQQLTSKY